MSSIPKAPEVVQQILEKYCKTEEEMEEFLQSYAEYFSIDNERIAPVKENMRLKDNLKKFADDSLQESDSDLISIPKMTTKKAIKFITGFLDDGVCTVDEVLSEIPHASARVKRFLERQCRTVEEMEEFLCSWDSYFIVENGRVAMNDDSLNSGRLKAADFFKDTLNLYDQPPNYMNFRGHIGQADRDVIYFVNSFYPGEEFRQFLLNHQDIFVLFEDDTVYLVENKSVEYFEECLVNYGEEKYFMNLRGHIGQAPDHVMSYINRCYPGEEFIEFLENNPDVFIIDGNGQVYLNREDATEDYSAEYSEDDSTSTDT